METVSVLREEKTVAVESWSISIIYSDIITADVENCPIVPLINITDYIND